MGGIDLCGTPPIFRTLVPQDLLDLALLERLTSRGSDLSILARNSAEFPFPALAVCRW
jgi:hypothetical protein